MGAFMRVISEGTNQQYHTGPDRVARFTLERDGLHVGRRGSYSVMYYWRDGRYDMIVISD